MRRAIMSLFLSLSIHNFFKVFFLNEYLRNGPSPKDISSDKNEKIDESEKPINQQLDQLHQLVDDHVELSDLSEDRKLVSHSTVDGNYKESQQKFNKDNHDSSSQDEIDVKQSISNGKY